MKNNQAYSYMKNIKSFAILILFTLGACSPASGTITPPAPTPAPTPEVISPDLVYLTSVLNSGDFGDTIRYGLSPNGKWLFQPSAAINGKDTLQLTSTIDPALVIKTPMSEDMGYRLDTYENSWSPDSSMIVLIGRLQHSHQVVIFHLEGEKPMTHAVFEYPDPDEFDDVNTFAWSPDSTRLALNSYGGTVYIIDRQARLLATFHQRRDWHKGRLLWTEEGIFYIIWDYWDSDKTPREPTELYLVDPDHPELQKKIYDSQENGFDLVSYNMEEHQLLLSIYYNNVDMFPKSQLLILNLNDGKIKQAIDLPGKRGTLGYINFDQPTFYRELSEGNQHIFVFDWSTKKLVDYGEYYPLTGWRNCFQGILGMKGKYGNYTLKIVQAKDIWRKAGR